MVFALRPASFIFSRNLRLSLNLWIRVLQLRQVSRPWSRVQVVEQRIVALASFQFRHAAVRIVRVAKNNRLSRTNCLARRHDLAVMNFSVLKLRLNLRVLNALHAVSTLDRKSVV